MMPVYHIGKSRLYIYRQYYQPQYPVNEFSALLGLFLGRSVQGDNT